MSEDTEKRPLIIIVIVVVNVFLLLVYAVQLVLVAGRLVENGQSVRHLSLLGVALLAFGLPFFWRIRGLGWVCLLLANASLVLDASAGLLLSFQAGTAANPWDLLSMLVHVSLLGVLLVGPVLRLYSSKDVRQWDRAERVPTRLHGKLVFGGRLSRGTLTDVSLSGCSFQSHCKIPIGEVVEFHGDGGENLTAQVIREIFVTQEEGFAALFDYGARFHRKPKDAVLVRLQEEGLRSLLQPSRDPSDPSRS